MPNCSRAGPSAEVASTSFLIFNIASSSSQSFVVGSTARRRCRTSFEGRRSRCWGGFADAGRMQTPKRSGVAGSMSPSKSRAGRPRRAGPVRRRRHTDCQDHPMGRAARNRGASHPTSRLDCIARRHRAGRRRSRRHRRCRVVIAPDHVRGGRAAARGVRAGGDRSRRAARGDRQLRRLPHARRTARPTPAASRCATPFGTIYGTNITPDAETGIGALVARRRSRARCARASSRDGHHLYPAFPYDHFTRLTDDDLHALYAFLMTRDAGAGADAAPTDCASRSASGRCSPAGTCCTSTSAPRAAPTRSAERRVEPRRLSGRRRSATAAPATRRATRSAPSSATRYLAGGEAEGWHAPALERRLAVAAAVDVDAADRLSAHRPRAATTRSPAGRCRRWRAAWRTADPADVRAIAAYIALGARRPDARAPGASAQPAPRRAAARWRCRSAAHGAASDAPGCDSAPPSTPAPARAATTRGRGVSSGGALQLPLAVARARPRPAQPDPHHPRRHRAARRRARPLDAGVRRRADRRAARRRWSAYLRRYAAGAPPWPDLADAGAAKRQAHAMITLNVNGQRAAVDADPATPLLYVLRDDLRLNGAKFGCGLGQCGACTVMVDGDAGVLVPDAGLGWSASAPVTHRRGPRHAEQARARCSAPSSTSRRRSAATASPA